MPQETVSPLRQSPRMPLFKSKLRTDGWPAQVVEATLWRRFVPLSYVQVGAETALIACPEKGAEQGGEREL